MAIVFVLMRFLNVSINKKPFFFSEVVIFRAIKNWPRGAGSKGGWKL